MSRAEPEGHAPPSSEPTRTSRLRVEHLVRFRSWAVRRVRETIAHIDRIEILLGVSIVAFTAVYSQYLFAKYADYRTSFQDFGNFIQVVWIAAHGQLTTFVLGRPFLLLPALVSVVLPTPQVLIVFEVGFLAFGAIPIYLIANDLFKSRAYSLALAWVYLMFPPLTGILQYEFHDFTLAIPFFLFMYYFYSHRRLAPTVVFGFLAITTNAFCLVIVGFFGAMVLVDYALERRPRQLLYLFASLMVVVVLWVVYLAIVPATFGVTVGGTYPGSEFTLSGSGVFLNVSGTLKNLPDSIGYAITSKLAYLCLLFGPFLFLPILAWRRLIPALPWIAVVILYSPILEGSGQVGPVYQIWSQWGGFLIPFIFIAGLTGLSKLTDLPGIQPEARRAITKRSVAVVCVVTLVFVAAVGTFSPFQPQVALSLGDNLVPTDVPAGQFYHAVWPTPVANAGTLDQLVGRIPLSASVLSQGPIESKLSERYGRLWLMGVFAPPPGVNPDYILIDTNLPGYSASVATPYVTSGNYTAIYLAIFTNPSVEIGLYEWNGLG